MLFSNYFKRPIQNIGLIDSNAHACLLSFANKMHCLFQ